MIAVRKLYTVTQEVGNCGTLIPRGVGEVLKCLFFQGTCLLQLWIVTPMLLIAHWGIYWNHRLNWTVPRSHYVWNLIISSCSETEANNPDGIFRGQFNFISYNVPFDTYHNVIKIQYISTECSETPVITFAGIKIKIKRNNSSWDDSKALWYIWSVSFLYA